MNNDHIDVESSSDDSPHAAAGKILAAQREKLGMSIAECSEVLKITNTKLQALEQGDPKPFPSEVFLRGYIKSYAKLLHLPEEDVLQHYDAQSVSSIDDATIKMKKPVAQTVGRWWIPYVVGFVIVLLWFLLSDFLSFNKEEQEKVVSDPKKTLLIPEVVVEIKSEENLTEEDVEKNEEPSENILGSVSNVDGNDVQNNDLQSSVEENAQELQDTAVASVEETEQAVVEVVETSGSDSETVSAESADVQITDAVQETQSETSVIEPGNNRLYMTFEEECWVRVVDANDQVLISSLREPRSNLSLVGKAPFSIIIGNVKGTNVFYEGELVSLAGSSDGRTLRLTLGE